MQITQTPNIIAISTDNSDTFFYFKQIINKNFSQNIGKKAKLMSFYVENENPQRRYFIKLINSIYKKQTQKCLEHLSLAHFKTIKLAFNRTNELKPILNINLSFSNTKIIFEFDICEKIFITYLQNYFKNHSCTHYDKYFVLDYKDSDTFELFDKFCDENEHLYFMLNFNLDDGEYLNFQSNIEQNLKKEKRARSGVLLVAHHFKTLELDTNVSFEVVRKKYLKLSKLYHPDFHQEKSKEVQDILRAKFEKINLAYEGLRYFFNIA